MMNCLRQLEAGNAQVGRTSILSVSKSEYNIQDEAGHGKNSML